jgi:hypothetical protein
MEDKLQSYRLRKRRTERVESIKQKIFGMFTSQQKEETQVKIEVSCQELFDTSSVLGSNLNLK